MRLIEDEEFEKLKADAKRAVSELFDAREEINRLKKIIYDNGICPDCAHKLTEHGLLPLGGMDCPVPLERKV